MFTVRVGVESLLGELQQRSDGADADTSRLHGRSSSLELHVEALAQRPGQRVRLSQCGGGPRHPRRLCPRRAGAHHRRASRLHLTPRSPNIRVRAILQLRTFSWRRGARSEGKNQSPADEPSEINRRLTASR